MINGGPLRWPFGVPPRTLRTLKLMARFDAVKVTPFGQRTSQIECLETGAVGYVTRNESGTLYWLGFEEDDPALRPHNGQYEPLRATKLGEH